MRVDRMNNIEQSGEGLVVEWRGAALTGPQPTYIHRNK